MKEPFTAWAFLVVQGLVRDLPGDRETFVAIVHQENDRDITGPSVASRVAASLRRGEIALAAAGTPDPWGKIAAERLKGVTSSTEKEGVGKEAPSRKPWWKFR